MKFSIEVIPHKDQRYETAGDWFWTGDNLTIKVSDMGDWRYNATVAVHELIEALLCKHDGISQDAVDEFDIDFEKNRTQDDTSEPGDDPAAPYHRQHCLATSVERMLIAELQVPWQIYDDAANALQAARTQT
jgi:hypothetical protein